jgi:hypothetical protein
LTRHTSPNSKRQRIRDLILSEAKVEDIVDEVKTTKEYVYKEKGKLKQEGLLVTQQSLSVSNGQNKITVVKDQPHLMDNVGLGRSVPIDPVNDYDISRLNKNELMLMYNDFEDQKGPTYVTAKHGIHPEISQKEFERVLKMKSRDPYVLQQMLTAGISNASPEIQALVDKSSSTLLTNDEIMSIINNKMWNHACSFTRNVVVNPANYLPQGLERVRCKICKEQQAGVIYDRNMTVGSYAQQVLNVMCDSCRALQNDLAPQLPQ